MNREPSVFVVDDDEAMRTSLKWLIESIGLRVLTFGSAEEFLAAYCPGRPGCLLVDVRMPGMSGLELQARLAKAELCLPVIVITGHGDVAMAVRAMKAGALDFIEKPFNDEALLGAIRRGLDRDATQRRQQLRRTDIAARLEQLTPREHEVMALVTDGKSNKEIAAALGVSAKTVEAHRARVMDKMQADSLADLVRMALLVAGPDA
ncbi:response regulator transcription factor [Thiococcus pfennigii]|jgi:RNA polymerase sigma factor (sigma-70 family)|uniref:response regulator transcription factor n=1 Tax=Thiococcus pfennigii TaxID=1057 RepID=UPI0019068613|nr:response regulator transcription factor [Thiococcus pfennigii]MBK1702716.1 DNA-binding response regulator [Thiococcus pfennigii]MBK1731225.1 DNA-binding response regulator [Thiococcus pfennigii]